VKYKADKARMAEAEKEGTEERENIKRKKIIWKLTIEEKMEIERIVEEKQEEKEDLIEIRTVEKIVPKRFHKYLKVFEKKKSERIAMRKP